MKSTEGNSCTSEKIELSFEGGPEPCYLEFGWILSLVPKDL